MSTPRGYWRRLWQALRGREGSSPPPPARLDDSRAADNARAAGLEMELRERDRQIVQMRKEYELLQAAQKQSAAGAGEEHLERLYRRLAAPLSTLLVLGASSQGGQEVAVADVLQVVRELERVLKAGGLEPIGTAGEQTAYDVTLHQRMSGGGVHAGSPVTVQIPGFRLGAKVLQKAMVSGGGQ